MALKKQIKPVKKQRITAEFSECSQPLCDRNASENTKKLASLLKYLSINSLTMYGHQNEFSCKAGTAGKYFSPSDTFDITGYYAPVCGLDALSLTGNEYGKWFWSRNKRIKEAVKLAEKIYAQGSFITFSAHMPNFELISQMQNGTLGPEDEKYKDIQKILDDGSINFHGYTPNDLRGTVVKDIVAGGKLNSIYRQYLDLIAGFFIELQEKNLPLIFRPFHENSGGWFWWGTNSCSAEEFKKLWQYTYEYFVNEKDIHNLIWAYSPGSEAKTREEFLERYPGDSYVDLIGIDMYERLPEQKDTFFEEFDFHLKLHSEIAAEHNKLFACTETGVAHENGKALLETGNEDMEWYQKIADCCIKNNACYFLLWANFSRHGGYYAPYVEKKGIFRKTVFRHEMTDSFIRMFNDRRTIFSKRGSKCF